MHYLRRERLDGYLFKPVVTALIVLILMSIWSIAPVYADEEMTDSGEYKNLTWSMDSDGVLEISGSREIFHSDNFPWDYAKDRISSIIINEGITGIGDYAFRNCSSLTSINIPESVTSIGDCAFENCSSLKSINIPESVTSIGVRAFEYCSSLTSINIHGSIPWINGSTFKDCSSLTSINIPESVTSIGDDAFVNCSSLTSINIPENVTSIGACAFENCSSLTSMAIPDSVINFGFSCFSNVPKYAKVYVVKGSTAESVFRKRGFSKIMYLFEPGNGNAKYVYSLYDKINFNRGEIVSLTDYIVSNTSYSASVRDEMIVLCDNGKLAAITEGSTELAISYGDSGLIYIPIVVSPEMQEAVSFDFESDSISLDYGDTAFLKLILSPEESNPPSDIIWKSSDQSIVECNGGLVTAKDRGTAIVTATSGTISATCTVNVNKPMKALIALDEERIGRGQSRKLYYYSYPSGNDDESDYSFASSDPDTVSVSDKGIITANNAGAADITISKGAFSKKVKVSVSVPLEGISIVGEERQLLKNSSTQLKAIYDPVDTTFYRRVTWSSSDPLTATVDSNGVVTALKKGIVTISATTGDYTAEYNIICLEKNMTEIALDTTSKEIKYGESFDLEVSWLPIDTTDDTIVTWTSSDTKVAKVDGNGHVTATGVGDAVITAVVGEFEADCSVTIVKADPIYEIPEKVTAHCNESLYEIDLPNGFMWEDPELNVGAASNRTFKAAYTPGDTNNYNIIENIEVNVEVTHDFSADWTKDGIYHWHECVCGEKSEYSLHTEEIIQGVAATCTESGLTEGKKCTVCREILVPQEEIPALGHTWETSYTVDVEATEDLEGSESIHCSVCSAIKPGSERIIPAKGENKTDDSHKQGGSGETDKSGEANPSESSVPSSNTDPDTTESSRTNTESSSETSETSEPSTNPSSSEEIANEETANGGTSNEETVNNEPSNDPANQLASDGTALGKGASIEAVESAITSAKSDVDLKGSVYNKLKVKQSNVSNNSIKISWSKISGAKKYVVFAGKSAKKNKLQKITTTTKTKYTLKKFNKKKLTKGTYYKFAVVAINSSGKVVSSSKFAHIATSGKNSASNPVKVTTKAKNNKVTVKVKKTFKLAGSYASSAKKYKIKKILGMRYESTNTKVATVSSKGVIKGIKKGTCYVYAYAQNGIARKIKVTVK